MKLDSPKWGMCTVVQVDGPSKVSDVAESVRSCVEVDGPAENGRSKR